MENASNGHLENKFPQLFTGNEVATYDPELVQKLKAESQRDMVLQQEARKALEKIAQDYKKIAKVIQKQNRKARSLLDSLRDVKEGEGIVDKAKAAWGVAGTITDKLPVIGPLKSYAERKFQGEDLIHSALGKQYSTANELKSKLYEILHADKGIYATVTTITGEIMKYVENIKATKQEITDHTSRIVTIDKEMTSAKKTLEERLGKPYQSIKVEMLDTDQGDLLDLYHQIQSKEHEKSLLDEKKSKLEKDKQNLEISIQGKQTVRAALVVYRVEGEDIYKRIDNLLKQSEGDVTALVDLAQFEQIIAKTSEVSNALVENYNRILETSTGHARDLAQHGEGLVPQNIYRVPSLINAMNNLQKAATIYIEHHGSSGALEFKEAILQLTEDKAKELPG